jgi:hypothetical protein
MINRDEEEGFLQKRDELEYLASFINPEAVSKVKEMRRNTKAVSDDDFTEILKNVSGRTDLPEFVELER